MNECQIVVMLIKMIIDQKFIDVFGINLMIELIVEFVYFEVKQIG